MASLALTNARVVTVAGPPGPRRGSAHADLGVIDRGYVLVDGETIAAVDAGSPPPDAAEKVLDLDGRVLMPGFVDCHTHACWAGDRFDEFEMKLRGAAYLEILKAGGGIMSTVRAVRAADLDELTIDLQRRAARMLALGTTTLEVKSGYGLETAAEMRMLEAIERLAAGTPQLVVPTFLGAHAIDADNPRFVEQTIDETLPAVVERFGPITCDAYTEDGAWSLEETTALFERARALGCPLRVHTDQFNSLGMTARAIEMGAVSVDHLEATTDEDLALLAESETIAVALPCSGFQVDDRYAPARRLVDLGAAVAVASNYNPGSAPTPSVPFAIALAARKLGLTPAEAIVATTINAACVLGLDTAVGSIEPGKRADLQVLDASDERELAYEFATPGPALVIAGGEMAAMSHAALG